QARPGARMRMHPGPFLSGAARPASSPGPARSSCSGNLHAAGQQSPDADPALAARQRARQPPAGSAEGRRPRIAAGSRSGTHENDLVIRTPAPDAVAGLSSRLTDPAPLDTDSAPLRHSA